MAVAAFAIAAMDVHPGAELNMLAVDLDTMADLHVKWMDLPGPTDVMSFPMDELTPGGRPDMADAGPATLGDIVLCPQFAAEQALNASFSTFLNHEGSLKALGSMTLSGGTLDNARGIVGAGGAGSCTGGIAVAYCCWTTGCTWGSLTGGRAGATRSESL